ncbi:MAG: nitronate monooxygenase family protein [Candidatus Pelagadaptatus aseana]|uniref:NAD(P)H-dependent flavin oxidoreductase n=1 Tax=Candidatus Pelagadaptatus aseana TaxID=3120508 RepID=UPI0039B2E4AE
MALPAQFENRLSIPLIGSPLFIISNPRLVIEQCKAGIIGSFPALNARPAELLDSWLEQITSELEQYRRDNPDKPVAPYAVNQIVHRSNERLQHDIDLCVKHKVPVVITSLMAPTQVVGPVHSYGGLVFHDVTNVHHAKKAIAAGVDGLILVCAGAGGHAGSLSPFALVSEIREFYDGTIILSGAMSSGRDVLAAEAMGADMGYMGTRFIATREAQADERYKQMLVDSSAEDIIYSNLFTGVHGNYLKPSIKAAGLDPDNLQDGDKSTMDWSNSDSKAWKDVWGSGQGIGSIKDVPATADLVANMVNQYQEAKQKINSKPFPLAS